MGRQQRFFWALLVAAILFTGYGAYLLIYNLNKGNGFSVLHLTFLIIGSVLLLFFFIAFIFQKIKDGKEEKERGSAPISDAKDEMEADRTEEKAEEPEEEEIEEAREEERPSSRATASSYYDRDYDRPRSSYSRYDGGTAYVKKVGYGPMIRVSGPQVLDMRTNTYYRIQGNFVYQDGSGVVYEISGNRIRSAFGSYLFEISGSNINKTFGGFFASISGNYITVYDLSEKYEMSDSLSRSQLLVVVALLFG